MSLKLKKFDESFLEKSWEWLLDPEIKHMTNTPDFTKRDQYKWFSNLEKKTDYCIWGLSIDGKRIGVCGLKNITNIDCEYWGYIGEKEFWGKGFGKIILDKMVKKALSLQLKSIWLKVLKDNIRAINLYERKGFITEKFNGENLIMRKTI